MIVARIHTTKESTSTMYTDCTNLIYHGQELTSWLTEYCFGLKPQWKQNSSINKNKIYVEIIMPYSKKKTGVETDLIFCVFSDFVWSFNVHAMAASIEQLSQLYKIVHLHKKEKKLKCKIREIQEIVRKFKHHACSNVPCLCTSHSQ